MQFGQAMDKVKPILNKSYGGVCSFGFLGDNFHKAFHAQACHYEVKNADSRTEYFYTTVTPELEGDRFEVIYDFVMWALGDDGPWRSIVADKDRAIVVQDKKVTGFLLEVSGTTGAAMLRNLCMAIRLSSEWRKNFEAYLRFKAEGLKESDAFYLGNLFAASGDKVVKTLVYNSNHLIVPMAEDFHLKRFEEGRPYDHPEKLNGVGANPDRYHREGRTTAVFRQKKSIEGLPNINTLIGQRRQIKSRWHTMNVGLNFDKAARVYLEQYKPKLLEGLAA